MEKDRQEVFNHVCKFCSRSFPCGRSLGGHVKSHMIIIRNNYSSSAKNTFSKIDVAGTTGRSRKEKPKNSKRVAEDNIQDKDHDHDHDQSSQEDTSGLESIIDSHSDNETATPTRNQRRMGRSKRRVRLDSNCNNLKSNYDYDRNLDPNGSSSVFDIEHEQEEVAICLIMVSRDIHGFSETTDDISVRNSVSYTKGTESEILKKKYKLEQKNNSKSSDTFANSTKRRRQKHQEAEFFVSKMEKTKVSIDGFVKVRPGTLELSKTEVSEMDNIVSKDLDKKPRFECVTCKKSFSSYQALGGHRASHKKNKDGLCCGSKVKPNITINSNNNDNKNGYSENKKTRHECPICLKVFTSGQALGGHKRSHLVDVSEVQEDGTTATNVVVIGNKPGCEIRSFLDLNKPALVDEDVKFHMGFDQWWISS